MIEPHERELRNSFHALRREEAVRTPPFDATVVAARRRTGPRLRRGALVLAAAAVLTGVALALVLAPHRQGARIDLATVHWDSPTDFLLRLPGDELLRTAPELGFTASSLTWRIP